MQNHLDDRHNTNKNRAVDLMTFSINKCYDIR